MSNHWHFLKDSSGAFFVSCLLLCLVSSVVLGDEVNDLISRSEVSGAKAAIEASTMIDAFSNNAVGESVPTPKIVDTPPSQSLKQRALKDVQLPHEGKKNCKDNTSQGSSKCSSSLLQGMEAKQASKSSLGLQLLIFVSQSVPAESLKELWNEAQRVGGKLVFRGLVGGSFKETQRYIQELGIVADIDPTNFEEFEVTQVPTFVLSVEKKHDRMVGNASLIAFLEHSSTSGECKEEAAKLYKSLQGGES